MFDFHAIFVLIAKGSGGQRRHNKYDDGEYGGDYGEGGVYGGGGDYGGGD